MTVAELGRRMDAREFAEWRAEFALRAGGGPKTDAEQEAALRAELTARVQAGLAAKRAAREARRRRR